MKKPGVRVASSAPSVALGSQSARGVDVAALYIDMLCEHFKDRGIKVGVQSGTEPRGRAKSKFEQLYPDKAGVSASDSKYRSQNIGGRACMSSEDFANYYRDLRDYKLPRFYSRAESEYEEADTKAKAIVQESGRTPKKAKWLAVTKHAGKKIKEIPSHLNKEEFTQFAESWFEFRQGETVAQGEKKSMPRGILPIIFAVTLSLLLIVCASVMVSRASAEVASLESKLEDLDREIRDLEGKLEVKNDLLEIKRIAVEEYGMISAEYASSRYVDIKERDTLVNVDGDKGGSWLSDILRAIGFGGK